MKQCSKCRVYKPEDQFAKNKYAKDGLCWWCKSCLYGYMKYYQRRYRKENPEKVRSYWKKYREKDRKKYNEKNRNWYQRKRKFKE